MAAKTIVVVALDDLRKGQLALADLKHEIAKPITEVPTEALQYGLVLVKAVRAIRRGERGPVEVLAVA